MWVPGCGSASLLVLLARKILMLFSDKLLMKRSSHSWTATASLPPSACMDATSLSTSRYCSPKNRVASSRPDRFSRSSAMSREQKPSLIASRAGCRSSTKYLRTCDNRAEVSQLCDHHCITQKNMSETYNEQENPQGMGATVIGDHAHGR